MNVQHSFNITVNAECLLIQIHCSMTMTQFILQQKCKIKEHYNKMQKGIRIVSCRQIALSNESFLLGFASMSLLFVLFRNKIAAH